MENKKLTWEEIKKLYDQQWVELVDYEWDDSEIDPRAGVVRVHAKTRKKFDELILQSHETNSALVFIGTPPAQTTMKSRSFTRIVHETSDA